MGGGGGQRQTDRHTEKNRKRETDRDRDRETETDTETELNGGLGQKWGNRTPLSAEQWTFQCPVKQTFCTPGFRCGER